MASSSRAVREGSAGAAAATLILRSAHLRVRSVAGASGSPLASQLASVPPLVSPDPRVLPSIGGVDPRILASVGGASSAGRGARGGCGSGEVVGSARPALDRGCEHGRPGVDPHVLASVGGASSAGRGARGGCARR